MSENEDLPLIGQLLQMRQFLKARVRVNRRDKHETLGVMNAMNGCFVYPEIQNVKKLFHTKQVRTGDLIIVWLGGDSHGQKVVLRGVEAKNFVRSMRAQEEQFFPDDRHLLEKQFEREPFRPARLGPPMERWDKGLA